MIRLVQFLRIRLNSLDNHYWCWSVIQPQLLSYCERFIDTAVPGLPLKFQIWHSNLPSIFQPLFLIWRPNMHETSKIHPTYIQLINLFYIGFLWVQINFCRMVWVIKFTTYILTIQTCIMYVSCKCTAFSGTSLNWKHQNCATINQIGDRDLNNK